MARSAGASAMGVARSMSRVFSSRALADLDADDTPPSSSPERGDSIAAAAVARAQQSAVVPGGTEVDPSAPDVASVSDTSDWLDGRSTPDLLEMIAAGRVEALDPGVIAHAAPGAVTPDVSMDALEGPPESAVGANEGRSSAVGVDAATWAWGTFRSAAPHKSVTRAPSCPPAGTLADAAGHKGAEGDACAVEGGSVGRRRREARRARRKHGGTSVGDFLGECVIAMMPVELSDCGRHGPESSRLEVDLRLFSSKACADLSDVDVPISALWVRTLPGLQQR